METTIVQIFDFLLFEIFFKPSNMDQELLREIEHILTLDEDLETQKKSLSKVLVYLLTISSPEASHNPLIKKFLSRAFEILPSSSLPQQLAKKLEINVPRKRSISFTTSNIHRLPKQQILSAEGEEQNRRETVIMGMVNLDIHRKFIPTNKITPGLRNTTANISITESLLVNTFNPKTVNINSCNMKKDTDLKMLKSQNQEITLPNISVDEIIKNPTILKSFILQ